MRDVGEAAGVEELSWVIGYDVSVLSSHPGVNIISRILGFLAGNKGKHQEALSGFTYPTHIRLTTVG